MTTDSKDLNGLIRAAFMAGRRHGAGYHEIGEIPDAESEIQLRAFIDAWHGNAWSPQDWERARRNAGMFLGIDVAPVRHTASTLTRKKTSGHADGCNCKGGPHGGYTDPRCK